MHGGAQQVATDVSMGSGPRKSTMGAYKCGEGELASPAGAFAGAPPSARGRHFWPPSTRLGCAAARRAQRTMVHVAAVKHPCMASTGPLTRARCQTSGNTSRSPPARVQIACKQLLAGKSKQLQSVPHETHRHQQWGLSPTVEKMKAEAQPLVCGCAALVSMMPPESKWN